MNDFTKEELFYLKDGIAEIGRCEMNSLLREKIEKLWVKTSKMIDNYCEHKNTSINGAELVCEDCGKVWK